MQNLEGGGGLGGGGGGGINSNKKSKRKWEDAQGQTENIVMDTENRMRKANKLGEKKGKRDTMINQNT